MIDCKKIAEDINQAILNSENKNRGLAIIDFERENMNTNSYVNSLIDDANRFNVELHLYTLPPNVTTGQVCQVIANLNNNPNVSGIVIAYPLPKNIDEQQVINIIDPKKDIDGLKGNESEHIPATVHATMTVIHSIYKTIENKNILLIGKGKIGNSLIPILLEQGANLTICHSKTSQQKLNLHCMSAEIIISAAGKKDLINHNSVINGVQDYTIIDIGRGDVNSELYDTIDNITPTKNGLGLVTRSLLFNHLISNE